jgi:hypothetical protein
MQTPIKNSTQDGSCASLLKQMVPVGSVIDTFLFYSGAIEYNLASYDRFVRAHTTNYYIDEFWKCARIDARKVHSIVTSEVFRFNEEEFPLLQEKWPMQKDPFIRAALFFLLNRCSETGMISSGELNMANFNPVALNYLRAFKEPKNFHLKNHENKSVLEVLKKHQSSEIVFIPGGNFSYNFFEEGKNKAYEASTFKHVEIYEALTERTNRWIINYKQHRQLKEIYKNFNIIMIDKYGNKTTIDNNCEEVLIANY